MLHPDGTCIFCRVANEDGHAGHEVVWQNADYVAFLDARPNTDGAIVIISRHGWGSDMGRLPTQVLTGFMAAFREVNDLVTRAFPDVDRCGFAADGYGVPHAHLKVYPLHGTRDEVTGEMIRIRSQCADFYPVYRGFMSTNASDTADPAKLRRIADQIRGAA